MKTKKMKKLLKRMSIKIAEKVEENLIQIITAIIITYLS